MVYCCFWLAIVTSFSVGQAGTVRQVYRSGCHKSIRFLCAVRFLFQFRVDAGNQLVRWRCGRFCRKYRRDTEPSAADQHLALFCDAVFFHTSCCVPENSCDIAILCLPKFCTLRHISAENTSVSVNLPILFHRPPFCLLHGGCFYRCCSIVQSS